MFSRSADAIDVHLMIGAFCVFRVANRHTWSTLFGCDPQLRDRCRSMLVDHLRGDATTPG